MQPVDISEIKNIADYEIERETLRPRVLALKERRRIRLGDHLTFLFENRETVRYQIQEMMRIERIVRPHDIAHEVATYNELIPAQGGLCASLLIEYETPAERDVKLRELLGLERHLWIEVSGAGRTASHFRRTPDCHGPHQLRAISEVPPDRSPAEKLAARRVTRERSSALSRGTPIHRSRTHGTSSRLPLVRHRVNNVIHADANPQRGIALRIARIVRPFPGIAGVDVQPDRHRQPPPVIVNTAPVRLVAIV